MPDDLAPTRPRLPDPDATAAAPPPAAADDAVTTDRTVSRAFETAAAGPRVGPSDPLALPGYEFVREVGRGGMGVVYEARQVALNRTVAVKMVLGDVRAEGRALARFKVEAEAVAAVRHPNVLQVHDCGDHLGRPFLVLEFCPGGALGDRLQRAVRPDPAEAAALMLKVARGVGAAHARGVVHRDLKPGNILFGEDGEPKVADFGLAKLAAGANITQVGDVMGTPAYMAPEQAGGRAAEVGPAADVWALGVILYECLTGSRPFTGETTTEVLAAVQAANPEPPRRRAPVVPRDLEYICLKCLRRSPRDRYPSAGELAAELQRYITGEPLGARRREWAYRARMLAARWWRQAAAAAGVAALAGVWWAARPPAAPPDPPPVADPRVDPALALRREEVLRRVEAVTRGTPHPDRESPHPVTHLPDLPPATMDGFRVLSDERVMDLRGWRPLPPDDPAAESSVVFRIRRLMLKTAPVNELRTEGNTTGRDLVPRAFAPNPDRAKVFTTDRTAVVGGQVMKVRQLVLDVSDVPVDSEFSVHTTNTFWNNLQTPEERWLGVVGYEGSLKASILMVFPDDRPFRAYTLRVAPTRNEPPVPFTGPVITFKGDDNRWLYWEIPSPRAGHVYRVDWTW